MLVYYEYHIKQFILPFIYVQSPNAVLRGQVFILSHCCQTLFLRGYRLNTCKEQTVRLTRLPYIPLCSWYGLCLVHTSSIVSVLIDGFWRKGPVHCVKETL